MDIEFTGRRVEITPALKQLTIEKLDRIQRHSLPILNVHVIFTVEKHIRQIAEANLHLSGIDINAKGADDDMYKALDIMVDRLDRQVKKHKRKLTSHHRVSWLKNLVGKSIDKQ